MKMLKAGDPMDPTTDIGPLAGENRLQDLDNQVRRAVAVGAKVLTGGRPLNGHGCLYEPTVLVDVPRSSEIYREEFFGPVAMLFHVQNAAEAIELANDTQYGLGASVWTEDPEEAKQFAEGIEAGMVFINAMVSSDPRVPFGGIKRSGYGRELGLAGIHEFVNLKTVRYS